MERGVGPAGINEYTIHRLGPGAAHPHERHFLSIVTVQHDLESALFLTTSDLRTDAYPGFVALVVDLMPRTDSVVAIQCLFALLPVLAKQMLVRRLQLRMVRAGDTQYCTLLVCAGAGVGRQTLQELSDGRQVVVRQGGVGRFVPGSKKRGCAGHVAEPGKLEHGQDGL